MKKSDIETHAEYFRPSHPAINVKVYHFGVTTEMIQEKFKCDKETAEKAINYAFEMQQESFWEGVEELAQEIFGKHVKVYSEGRCGGWLVVHHLPDIETWDAIMVGKWAHFVRLIKQDIAWRVSTESLMDDITANEWAKPGAEKYNFVYSASGQPQCIADLKKQAINAGFGAVVRK